MALVTPLLLVLMFGSFEVGKYFYDEHKLVKSVRDGARYAARQRFTNFSACTGDVVGPVYTETKMIVRKGSLNANDPDLLPNWDNAGTIFTVKMNCRTTLTDGSGNYVASGIYAGMAGGAPSVTVTVKLPYKPVIGSAFGFSGLNYSLNASQNAAVGGL
ncbi:MAG: pilus assembly protein [Pseudomonadota bacterium]|nr:pilus assembly protein [Pseudomonadota bacterium]